MLFKKDGSGNGRLKNRANLRLGLGGLCICENCGKVERHHRGTPCYEKVCVHCGSKMIRK